MFFVFFLMVVAMLPPRAEAAPETPIHVGSESMGFDLAFVTPLIGQTPPTCEDVNRMKNIAEISYPNPHFMKRLDRMAIAFGCDFWGKQASVEQVRRAVASLPSRDNIVKSVDVCRFFGEGAPRGELQEWLDIAAQLKFQQTRPACIDSSLTWLWSALKNYHARRYEKFEKAVQRQGKWLTSEDHDFRRWLWERLILSAKRRGDRQQVLRYYRQWHQTLEGVPRLTKGRLDPEAVAVDLWRIRWEAMLGQAAKARALSANYKKWCGKYFEKNDKLCREFASTWLSRLWFEGHDNDERWVRKLKPIVETWTWWQLQRAVVRRNWAVAEALADRWMRLGGETSQERRSYWLHLVRARRNASSSKDVWREFADRYSSGEQDFYKLTAKHFAGYSLAADSSVASPPAQDDGDDEADDEETEQELAHKTDATCLPTLAPQWPKIKDARAEFLINDDLKWFSERWQLAPRRQCVGQIRAMERELLEHCQAGMLSQLPIVPYQDEFRTVSERFDVPRGLLAGLSKQESGFCAKAVSWADAIGLMQLQWSKRVRALGLLTHPEQLYDPKLNIEAGALELKRLRDRFQGNWFMTLAAYNAGEDVVRLWNKRRPHSSNFQFIETMPFQETRDYVRNVFANWMRYELKDPKSTSDSAFNHLARL